MARHNKAIHINTCPMEKWEIGIGPRPSKQRLTYLEKHGFTHVITLLSQREGAPDLGRKISQGPMNWIWAPFDSGKAPETEASHAHFMAAYDAMIRALPQQGKLYLHCSAGLHRTGMMVMALLRHCGASYDDALNLLGNLREITFEQVGAHRLAWIKANFYDER